MNRYEFITIDQPAGRFYIAKINASELIPISQSKERNPYNSTGIQRKLNLKRVKEIAQYCEDPAAMFPTPIILSGKSKYFNFYNQDSDELEKKDGYIDLSSGFVEIESEKIIKDGNFLSIVDGQHRLSGIENSQDSTKFDLLVMFIFDTENYEDAEIFSVINRNQKQVSKSLVYDLYGLTDDMTIEKFAHEIVKSLNTSSFSLLKNKIKMLGYKTDTFEKSSDNNIQFVSQGALVDKLLPMISKDLMSDNANLRSGAILKEGKEEQVLRTYLIQDNLTMAKIQLISFFNAWLNILEDKGFKNTIMFKTVGFIAGLKIYNLIYTNEKAKKHLNEVKEIDLDEFNSMEIHQNKDIKAENIINELQDTYYEELIKLNFDEVNLNEISSSLSGVKSIIDNLLEN